MTAQPKVVWVKDRVMPNSDIHYPDASYFEWADAIPMVPQSSLTAALAERDKLAEALAEATGLLRSAHRDQMCDDELQLCPICAFLTAQAAQGDGGNA